MDALLADLIFLVAILLIVVYGGGWRVIAALVAFIGFLLTGIVSVIVLTVGFVVLTVTAPFRLAYDWLRIRRLSNQGRKRYKNPS